MTNETVEEPKLIMNQNMCEITYDDIRAAMDGEPFTMSVTDEDEIEAITDAVNEGIDSHLEACNVEERGDHYEGGTRGFTATSDGPRWKKGEYVCMSRTLECVVSVESFPTFLRRLLELDCDLADSCLMSLGFDDAGKFVGREELGLE
jgi:hypothetical protein